MSEQVSYEPIAKKMKKSEENMADENRDVQVQQGQAGARAVGGIWGNPQQQPRLRPEIDYLGLLNDAANEFVTNGLLENLNLNELLGETEAEKPAEAVEDTKTHHQRVKAKSKQVKNHHGGFVFKVSEETRIRRFLILGCEGPTYYSTEKQIKVENCKSIIEMINNGKAPMIINEILTISEAARAPRQEATMIALALCARYRVHDIEKLVKDDGASFYLKYIRAMHAAALSIVNRVCRIPTHLFAFVANCEAVAKATCHSGSTGWGRRMRACIQQWYESKSVDRLAMHVTKYRQRDGWSHKDLFRLAHPHWERHRDAGGDRRLEVEQVYRYIIKGDLRTRKRHLDDAEEAIDQPALKYSAVQMDAERDSSVLNFIEAFLNLKPTSQEYEVERDIKAHGLVREHIPTQHLNSKKVWEALLTKMPMTAMIRNLGKMASMEILQGEFLENTIKKLTDVDQLKTAKIHPIQLLLAKCVYQSGHGDRGKLTWNTDHKVDRALEDAFYKSFINAPPTGKRFCFAFDVSGSMTSSIANTMLSCRTASAALSLISLRNEEKVECVGFCDKLVELPFKGDWNIEKICDHMNGLRFGNTDCALPMVWAKKMKKEFDVFVIYTDNETFFGNIHPFEALQEYREAMGIPDAKLIVMGMTATDFTIADPSDAGMLDIVGFDSSVPQLIHEFVNGQV